MILEPVSFLRKARVESAHVFPMLEMERVQEPIPADIHIHIFRCVLGRAQAQAVQAQGILVAFRGSVVILPPAYNLQNTSSQLYRSSFLL